jgi:hypothetical protein
MRKIVLILLLLTTVVLLYFFRGQIVGFFTAIARIYLQISPYTKACAYLLLSNSSVPVNTIVEITLITENCGSQNFTGYSEITLFDSLNRSIFSYSTTYTLDVYKLISTKITWFAFPEGKYLVRGKVFYDNKTEERYQFLDVFAPPPPPPPAPPAVPIPVVIAPPAILEMKLNFLELINVTQATSYPILVLVNNTGTVSISNLTLRLRSESELIKIGSIVPEVILELRPGTSGIFLSSIFVYPETLEGKYKLFLNVSNDIWRSGEITLNVKKLEIKERARDFLAYYRFLIDYLEDEAQRIERVEKRNITLALAKISEAKNEFKVAERLYDLMFYEKVIEKLEDVKKKIGEAVGLLTIAPPIEVVALPKVKVSLIPVYQLILIGALIISVVAGLNVWKKRRAPILRYKRW